ncbi:BON domain-containing protein [Pandoraea apista]|uniref:BON domain-containing protein n=1 Tax=Pandoraea apista TaxID=93218 RepID=A0A0B5F455_9BURK|nr:BON domain-containing protein [Pandoraea apista]AJE98135.1 BON domain protein [Pandoraea apista]AKH72147.1 BON domain protein [Pandoraea apista]AKI60578.1 BON domain protein [Pandoraea apista]ALS66381.1 BON domain-containing protein [Pandoraea apista]AVF38720.1 BON domain-containing protein [Pandoraea apista]
MSFQRVVKPLAAAALIVATLGGCAPIILGGAATGALVATDRRSVGAQTEDREIQVKAEANIANTLTDDAVHVNVTVFNRRVLLTGEVPDDKSKQRAVDIVRQISNVRGIVDEIAIGPKSSFGSRSNDAWITSKVKANLINTKEISANVFKVVTERGDVYLMGLVSEEEGRIAANVASRIDGVQKVIKLYEYVKPEEAQRLSTEAQKNPAPAQADDANAATVTTTPIGNDTVTAKPLSSPAPISEGPVKPGPSTKTGN